MHYCFLTVKFASLSSKEILPQVPPLTFSRWVSSRSGVSSVQNGICALEISHTCSVSILTKTSQTQRHQNMSHRMAERQSNVTQRHRTLFHPVFRVVIAQDSTSSYTVTPGPACHHCRAFNVIVHCSTRFSMSSHCSTLSSMLSQDIAQDSTSSYTVPLGQACHHCTRLNVIVHRSIRSSMSSLHKTQRHSTSFHSVQHVITAQDSTS